jgi:hypothetical protein
MKKNNSEDSFVFSVDHSNAFLLFILITFIFCTPCSAKQNSKFKNFWSKFKKATLAGNKEAVLKLTSIPFFDYYNDVYDKPNSLTCRSKLEFYNNFDSIFNQYTLKSIKSNSYLLGPKNGLGSNNSIPKGTVILLVTTPKRKQNLVFKNIKNNIYLVGIQYLE